MWFRVRGAIEGASVDRQLSADITLSVPFSLSLRTHLSSSVVVNVALEGWVGGGGSSAVMFSYRTAPPPLQYVKVFLSHYCGYLYIIIHIENSYMYLS
jgi:hypothetical protein